MTGYGFFRILQLLGVLAMFPLLGVLMFSGTIYEEVSQEAAYHRRLGAGWQSEYEKDFGSLSEARAKLAACVFGLVAIPCLSVWLYRTLRPAQHSRHNSWQRKRRHRHHQGSHLEQAVRYRRNALVGVYFGLAGIALAICLVIFRMGIFSTHESEVILGIFVFLLGDFTVLAGCHYWLKAKGQNEALVFIGVMPLTVVMIPFVRLIFLANPKLLVVAMVMMPLILVVVVFALPNQSGSSNRRASWDRQQDLGAIPYTKNPNSRSDT